MATRRLRKRLDILNETLKDYYGFILVSKEEGFEVQYLGELKAPPDLPMISFIHLCNLSIYPYSQRGVFSSEEKGKGEDGKSLSLRKG